MSFQGDPQLIPLKTAALAAVQRYAVAAGAPAGTDFVQWFDRQTSLNVRLVTEDEVASPAGVAPIFNPEAPKPRLDEGGTTPDSASVSFSSGDPQTEARRPDELLDSTISTLARTCEIALRGHPKADVKIGAKSLASLLVEVRRARALEASVAPTADVMSVERAASWVAYYRTRGADDLGVGEVEKLVDAAGVLAKALNVGAPSQSRSVNGAAGEGSVRITPEDMERELHRHLPGWELLIRTDPKQGWFVNLMSPDFQGRVIVTPGGQKDVSVGRTHSAYGATARAAFDQALALALGPRH